MSDQAMVYLVLGGATLVISVVAVGTACTIYDCFYKTTPGDNFFKWVLRKIKRWDARHKKALHEVIDSLDWD